MAKIDKMESPVDFIMYQFVRALKRPGIFLQINPLGVIQAELEFRKHRCSMVEFVANTLHCEASKVCEVLAALDLPEDLQVHKVRECLFALVRLHNPATVVETGVGGGYGSAYILTAMEQNKFGRLYSVDSSTYFDPQYFNLPKGMECGGVVPKHLRHRWELSLGGAEHDLPLLLARLGTIDMFIHDSLHTRANMEFEYEIAWKHLSPGGVLISHDIWKPWIDFAHKVQRPYVVYQHYGAMVK